MKLNLPIGSFVALAFGCAVPESDETATSDLTAQIVDVGSFTDQSLEGMVFDVPAGATLALRTNRSLRLGFPPGLSPGPYRVEARPNEYRFEVQQSVPVETLLGVAFVVGPGPQLSNDSPKFSIRVKRASRPYEPLKGIPRPATNCVVSLSDALNGKTFEVKQGKYFEVCMVGLPHLDYSPAYPLSSVFGRWESCNNTDTCFQSFSFGADAPVGSEYKATLKPTSSFYKYEPSLNVEFTIKTVR